ncbi:Rhodanese-like domain-containing protein [Endogone sp. FLAS-F59071]|nr:Rhodanese-like domain-containing protein [Endogone sp. FLAS-F59071]|eukprot:RUS18141.1 Rhodanese-like domain-containing protein [Endogone sp. FLAS-F59071]
MPFRTTIPFLLARAYKPIRPHTVMISSQNAYSTGPSNSVPSLVSAQFLLTHNTGRGPSDLGITILDGSWHMPQSGRDPKKEFLERHIPGARFFGIDEIKDHTIDLPHMLPTSEVFSEAIGGLGITNTDHVIIYDTVNTFSATRVYWTFKQAKKYQPTPINTGILRDYKQIIQNVRARAGMFMIALPALKYVKLELTIYLLPSFTGADPEPRQGLSSGHMPGSISVPFGEVLDPATGEMLEPDELKRLFKSKGLDLAEQEIVASCGSGITASILYLALERAGAKSIAVYDGSWTEYAGKSAEEGTVIVKDV